MHGGLQMTNGTLTLVDALFQEAYICASVGSTSTDYNSRSGDPDFHAELIPVHSPLLRESCLVSCPPLTYMLKFSGFADLTSCLGGRLMNSTWLLRPPSQTMQQMMHPKTLNELIDKQRFPTSSMRQTRLKAQSDAQIRTSS